MSAMASPTPGISRRARWSSLSSGRPLALDQLECRFLGDFLQGFDRGHFLSFEFTPKK
jgi:hypothetical protein